MTVVPYRNRALLQKVQKNTKEIIEKEASINAKANKVDMDNSLALKANQADVDSSFANVNSALSLKANQADLILKADKNGSTNESFSTSGLIIEDPGISGYLASLGVVDVSQVVTTTGQNPTNVNTAVRFLKLPSGSGIAIIDDSALIAKDLFLTDTGTPLSLVRKLEQITPEATTTGVNQTAPVQGNFLFAKFNSIDSQVAARAHVINPTFTNNITVDNKVKVSDFAKIQLQDGSQHLGEFIDNKITNAPASSATRPKMRLTKFGGDNMALDWLFAGNSQVNTTNNNPHIARAGLYNGGARIHGYQDLTSDFPTPYNLPVLFGYSMSMSADGNRIAVGAPFSNGPNNNLSNCGAVAIYDWLEAFQSWTLVGNVIHGASANEQLGLQVVLSADGSRFACFDYWTSNRGRVHIYQVSTNTHILQHARAATIYDPAGAPLYQPQTFRTTTPASNSINQEFFGIRLACNHNLTRIVIGCPRNDELIAGADQTTNNTTPNGKVFVFEDTDPEDETVAWTLIGEFAGAPADVAGWSVAMSLDGTRVAYGAMYNDTNGHNSGKVTILQLHGDTGKPPDTTGTPPPQRWSQIGQILFGEGVEDYFGHKLAFSADGNLLAVASSRHSKPAEPQDPMVLVEPADPVSAQAKIGRAQVFKYVMNSTLRTATGSVGHAADDDGLTGKQWLQLGQDIYGPNASAVVESIALSADGSRIAVGTPESNAGMGGRVRVYDYNDERGIWERVGDNRKYNAATRLTWGSGTASRFGFNVCLSADGTRLAVGDFRANDTGSSGAGAVFIYDRLRNNTLMIKDTLTPRATDLEKSGMDLALGTQTVVNVFDSNGTQLSVNTISAVGNYTVEYISTNSKGESTKLTFNVFKYV